MKKTIFILTTRSFQADTLFNPGNCDPVEFRKDAPWYTQAFPQYFTDLIQFLDLYALQTVVHNHVLQQLPHSLKKTADLEKTLERAIRKHLKIYLKKKKKETGKKHSPEKN